MLPITKIYKEAQAWKETADRESIEEVAKRGFKYQLKACVILDEILSFPCAYARTQEEKEIKFAPFDLLVGDDYCIEIEVGWESLYWTDHLPLECWKRRGVSVAPTRKIGRCADGSSRWDLFIRFSWTFESFVAVTYEYLDAVGVEDHCPDHSLKINTNDRFMCIPIDKVLNDDQNMCFDDIDMLIRFVTNQIEKKNARLI